MRFDNDGALIGFCARGHSDIEPLGRQKASCKIRPLDQTHAAGIEVFFEAQIGDFRDAVDAVEIEVIYPE